MTTPTALPRAPQPLQAPTITATVTATTSDLGEPATPAGTATPSGTTPTRTPTGACTLTVAAGTAAHSGTTTPTCATGPAAHSGTRPSGASGTAHHSGTTTPNGTPTVTPTDGATSFVPAAMAVETGGDTSIGVAWTGGGGAGSGGGAGFGGGSVGKLLSDEGADDDRLARVGLCRVIEPGDLKALQAFGGMVPAEIWDMLRRKVRGTERWSSRLAETDPKRDLERAAAVGARFVIPGDDEWPEQIDVLAEAGQLARRAGVPFGLWVRGPLNLRTTLDQSVAMVGSRASSPYGEHVAVELSSGLADNGFAVVSGGAYGIDAAAHRGALATSGGATVAVLACGVDTFYPRRNSALLSRIAEQGLVVSELPPGFPPTKLRFLARNRLIAAATCGVVVIEAAARSGAINSAGWAEQCGRAVLAVPGPVTSRMSEGTHLLIRERGAVLVTNVAEVIEAISPLGTRLAPGPVTRSTPYDDLDHDQRRTLDAVPAQRAAPAERIAIDAGLDLDTTQECLRDLADLSLVEHDESGWHLPRASTEPNTTP